MRSFRFKLTLWNAAVLLVVLVSFGATAVALTERAVLRNIDRDLQGVAGRMRGNMPLGQGPGPGRPNFPVPRGDGDPYAPRSIGPDGLVGPPDQRPPLSRDSFEAARRSGSDLRTVEIEDRTVRVMSVRRELPGGGWQVVQFGRDLTDLRIALAQQRTVLILMLPVALVAAAVGGIFLVNRALKPVEDVTKAAAKIGAEDLSTRLEVSGDDELANLARTFNGMIERLDKSFAAMEESYEAQKRFVGDASHELRTPLSRIKLVSSAALTQQASQSEMTQALATIDKSADAMARLVEGLLQLARAEAGALALASEPLDLEVVVAEAIASLGSDVRVSVSGAGRGLGDADAVKRIVVNLLGNALRHTPVEGAIEVKVQDGEIVVRDEGEGIPDVDVARVKERFYRADPSRTKASGGAGLGLSICDSLVRAMGGSLGIESEQGKGTTVTVRLAVPYSHEQ